MTDCNLQTHQHFRYTDKNNLEIGHTLSHTLIQRTLNIVLNNLDYIIKIIFWLFLVFLILAGCYGWIVSPQNSYMELLIQCNGIWTWGLWEEIRISWDHKDKAHDECPCENRHTEVCKISLALSMYIYERKAMQEGYKSRRESSQRIWIIQHLDLGPAASKPIRNKCLAI